MENIRKVEMMINSGIVTDEMDRALFKCAMSNLTRARKASKIVTPEVTRCARALEQVAEQIIKKY